MTTAELAELAPGFDWDGVPGRRRAWPGATAWWCSENTAFPKIAAIYAETPLETLKAWQAFSLADDAAPYLSQALRRRPLRVPQQDADRPAGAAAALEARRAASVRRPASARRVGQVYVAALLPAREPRPRCEALVGDMQTALNGAHREARLDEPGHQGQGAGEARQFTVKIGYPDKWRDYSGADRSRPTTSTATSSAPSTFDWDFQRRPAGRAGGPRRVGHDAADRQRLLQPVRATRSSSRPRSCSRRSSIRTADPAINYGGIGGVIGHEITHGFDDQGRKYDGTGSSPTGGPPRTRPSSRPQPTGWARSTRPSSRCPGATINGELTMGENIADLGGLLLALDAYHASLHGQPAPIIDGLTGDQRVFLGWAQVWREQDPRRRAAPAAGHRPALARARAGERPMRNVDAWYAAFGVKPGDKMYVARRTSGSGSGEAL